MTSKQLSTILGNTPSATATPKEAYILKEAKNLKEEEKIMKIVARIPQSLKQQIREYIQEHAEETESTVVIKALNKMGFKVDKKWTIDRRKLR